MSEFGDGYRAGLAVGLDVERLATALMAYNDPGENDRTAATLGLYRKRARAIAAEYARLTPERPAEWRTPRGDTIEEVVTDATGQVIERYGSALQKLAERPAGEAVG